MNTEEKRSLKRSLMPDLRKIFGNGISLDRIEDNLIQITIKSNKADYFSLEKLSNLLNTKNINSEFYHYQGGCPTCDNGTYDEITYFVSNYIYKK